MTMVAAVCIRPPWPDAPNAGILLMLGLARTRDPESSMPCSTASDGGRRQSAQVRIDDRRYGSSNECSGGMKNFYCFYFLFPKSLDIRENMLV